MHASSSHSHIEDQLQPAFSLTHTLVKSGLAALLVCIGAAFIWMHEQPLYKAETKLLILTSKKPSGAMVDETQSGALPIQMKLLRSTALLEHVAQKLDLNSDPYFTQGDDVERLLAGFLGKGSTTTKAQVVSALSNATTLTQVGETRLIALSVTHSDAEKAATIANKLAEQYLALKQQKREQEAASKAAMLKKQIAKIRATIEREQMQRLDRAELGRASIVTATTSDAQLNARMTMLNRLLEQYHLLETRQKFGLIEADARVVARALPPAQPLPSTTWFWAAIFAAFLAALTCIRYAASHWQQRRHFVEQTQFTAMENVLPVQAQLAEQASNQRSDDKQPVGPTNENEPCHALDMKDAGGQYDQNEAISADIYSGGIYSESVDQMAEHILYSSHRRAVLVSEQSLHPEGDLILDVARQLVDEGLSVILISLDSNNDQGETPGIADAIDGYARYADLLHCDCIDGLHHVCSGYRPLTSEDFKSPTLHTAFVALEQAYDRLLIDCGGCYEDELALQSLSLASKAEIIIHAPEAGDDMEPELQDMMQGLGYSKCSLISMTTLEQTAHQSQTPARNAKAA